MDRIRGTTVAAALPAAATTGATGYFTGGDPASSVGATIITADWLNTIQEELLAVVTAAGLSPTPNNRTQVLQAINAMIAAASATPALAAGAIAFYATSNAPTGWLKANGATVSRSTYAALFSVIGTTWGAGDGSTTFRLPDLRGEFIRGWDDGRGVDGGRSFGSWQDDQFRNHSHSFRSGADSAAGNNDESNSSDTGGWEDGWIGSTGGPETRPRNVALLACIKY